VDPCDENVCFNLENNLISIAIWKKRRRKTPEFLVGSQAVQFERWTFRKGSLSYAHGGDMCFHLRGWHSLSNDGNIQSITVKAPTSCVPTGTSKDLLARPTHHHLHSFGDKQRFRLGLPQAPGGAQKALLDSITAPVPLSHPDLLTNFRPRPTPLSFPAATKRFSRSA
jgi:hypothetical protein